MNQLLDSRCSAPTVNFGSAAFPQDNGMREVGPALAVLLPCQRSGIRNPMEPIAVINGDEPRAGFLSLIVLRAVGSRIELSHGARDQATSRRSDIHVHLTESA